MFNRKRLISFKGVKLLSCVVRDPVYGQFIGVEVEQETSAFPPKKNPGSAPACYQTKMNTIIYYLFD